MREFKTTHLPTWLMQEVIKRRDDETVWPWARTWLEKAIKIKAGRTDRVTSIMQRTVNELAGHAHSLWSGKINQQRFVNAATATLYDGIQRSYLLGARAHDPSFALNSGGRAEQRNKVIEQSKWLVGLGQAVATLSTIDKASAIAWLNDNPSMRQRMALYAGALHGSHQRGELAGYKSAANDHPRIVWHVDSDAPCAHCAAHDAVEFSELELVAFPGEGMFDSDACVGGPNCRCFLTFEPTGVMVNPPMEPVVRPVPIPVPAPLSI